MRFKALLIVVPMQVLGLCVVRASRAVTQTSSNLFRNLLFGEKDQMASHAWATITFFS